jgi:hypothetical protein
VHTSVPAELKELLWQEMLLADWAFAPATINRQPKTAAKMAI